MANAKDKHGAKTTAAKSGQIDVKNQADSRSRLNRHTGVLICTAIALGGFVSVIVWIIAAATKDMIDVDVYASAGRALRNGAGLYTNASSAHNLPFLYPPFAAIVFVAFSPLGPTVLHVLWESVLISALGGICWISVRASGLKIANVPQWLLAMAVFGIAMQLEPITENLRFGQINIFVVWLIMADLTGYTWKLPRGILLGIAAGLKLTPLLFVAFLFLTFRRRHAIVAFLTFIGTVGLGLAFKFHDAVEFWTKAAYDTSKVGVNFATNQSVRAVVGRITRNSEPSLLVTALSALLVVFGLAIAVALARRKHDFVGVIVCGMTTLIVSPISWTHHWVWVVPALVALFTFEDKLVHKLAVLVAIPLFWWSPVEQVPKADGREYHHSFWQAVMCDSYFILALVLMAYLAWKVWIYSRDARLTNNAS